MRAKDTISAAPIVCVLLMVCSSVAPTTSLLTCVMSGALLLPAGSSDVLVLSCLVLSCLDGM